MHHTGDVREKNSRCPLLNHVPQVALGVSQPRVVLGLHGTRRFAGLRGSLRSAAATGRSPGGTDASPEGTRSVSLGHPPTCVPCLSPKPHQRKSVPFPQNSLQRRGGLILLPFLLQSVSVFSWGPEDRLPRVAFAGVPASGTLFLALPFLPTLPTPTHPSNTRTLPSLRWWDQTCILLSSLKFLGRSRGINLCF